MGFRKLATSFTVGLMALVAIAPLANAATATNSVVIKEDVERQAENTPPTKNWVEYYRLDGTAEFSADVADPPLSEGSLVLETPTGADKITVFNYDHVGVNLSDIDAISYHTYRTAVSEVPENNQQVAALNIQVDVNGEEAGGFTTLVFEPAYNTGQGAVVSDDWQGWDAYMGGDAIWWSSNAIPGVPNRDTFVSWDSIVAANPDAVILGGFGVNQGSGNPELVTAVDALMIGESGKTTTYDFEVQRLAAATSKDQCKNDGYKNFETKYKNQGDCVSAVASNDKAKGNPEQKNESLVTSFLRAIGLR